MPSFRLLSLRRFAVLGRASKSNAAIVVTTTDPQKRTDKWAVMSSKPSTTVKPVATVGDRGLSVREVAALRAVKPHKVLHWIVSGELHAEDVASDLAKRPRYKIYPRDLENFFRRRLDLRRAAAAEKRGKLVTKRACRRKTPPGVTEYF